MSPVLMPLVLIAVSVVSATAGRTLRDARARGLAMRKALTWAGISTQPSPDTVVGTPAS